ncbi:hypothetical protein N7492_010715 [Penicillium capsulatum]|uniref:Uncharacterized protein n=1 Tax=Penicillium capsulatum TaxID=69766 RepID=A0A9W9HL70_9EURO|nr:hypothetical protein N7492_010715 [Penicillium capsulatum]
MNALAQLINHVSKGSKAPNAAYSLRSWSSASTCIGYPTGPSAGNTSDEAKHPDTEGECWRRRDVEKMYQDPYSISLLCKFGLFDDKYAELKGLKPFCARQEECSQSTKSTTIWNVGPVQLLQEEPATIARKLSDESLGKFSSIPYEEFIRKAFGFTSDYIDSFLWKYEYLEWSLSRNACRASIDYWIQVKEALTVIGADPFLHATVQHIRQKEAVRAYLRSEKEIVGMEHLIPNLSAQLKEALDQVIEPLERLLSKPDAAQNVLEELQVVRFRFHDFYSPLNVDWNLSLDISNELLDEVRWMNIPSLAGAIARKDEALFSQYIQFAFTRDEHSKQACHVLNTRWNRLSSAVKEIMAAKIGLSSRIDCLADCLNGIRNYYSLTAIIQGIKASHVETEALHKFGKLLDTSDNYQQYRNRMREDSYALHFLLPAAIKSVQGDDKWAKIAIEASLSYSVHIDAQGPQMEFRSLSHNEVGGPREHEGIFRFFAFVRGIMECIGG